MIALAEAQGETFDEIKKKTMIEEGLLNGEVCLGQPSNSIQTFRRMPWEDVQEVLRDYDATSAGVERLRSVKIKTTETVSQVAQLGRAKFFSLCEHCKGRHESINCWKKYPEKRPKTNRKRFNNKQEASRPTKKFKFGIKQDSVSMISENMDCISLVEHDDTVFLDTCAMNYVWIFREQPADLNMRLVTGKLGTASKDGQLEIKGDTSPIGALEPEEI